jgi:tetratricopeptide (TPR) repeat protein
MLAHTMPAREMLSKAKEMALRALAIDRALAEAHTALGLVHALYDFNYEDAAERFQTAVRLNPGSSQAHSGLAIGYLAPTGRLAEAIGEMELAQEIDPLSPFVSHTLGTCLYFDAQYDRALEQGRKTIDLDERSALAHLLIGRIQAARGEFDHALQSFQAAMELEPSLSLAAAALGLCYGALGRIPEAQNIVETLITGAAHGYVSPYAIALAHLGAGAMETGMEWLDKAIDDRAGGVQFLAVEPLLNPYRSDSRFPGMIRKLGLQPRTV